MRVPELVVPVGSFEKLSIALEYGADAVYLSDKRFGLRYYADNFSCDEIKKIVFLVKQKNKKIYLAVNILCRNQHIEDIKKFFNEISGLNVDALIISDPGILRLAKQSCPHIPVHLSTQANTLNLESVKFWSEQGVKRVILARELSFQEVAETAKDKTAELEVFVHGALCIAYAGRCYLSAYLDGRESNLGKCSQPCRRDYSIVDNSTDNELGKFEFDDLNGYIFNSKDLCLIDYLPKLAEIGIDAVKIEGRMKTVYYLAVVTRIYREALDCLKSGTEITPELMYLWQEELKKISHRGYTKGFLGGEQTENRISKEGKYIHPYQFIGLVESDEGKTCSLNPKNRVFLSDEIEVVNPNRFKDRTVKVIEIYRDNIEVVVLNPNQNGKINFDKKIFKGELLRKKTPVKERKQAL